MPGVGHGAARDVAGDQPHVISHILAEKLPAPMANTGMVILPLLASNALLSAASRRTVPKCSKGRARIRSLSMKMSKH